MVTEYLDRRVEPARRLSRFLIFALAAILALSALTARLFYLQIANGVEFSALAEQNRTALQSVPAPRGLIFDRKGRPLVTNAAMYSVKVRAADIPEDRRDEVVERLAALLNTDVTEINTAIDTNPGSRFDLVRIAENVNESTARDHRGVPIGAPRRRGGCRGGPPVPGRAARVADPRVHGPDLARAVRGHARGGLPSRRLDRQGRGRGDVRNGPSRRVRDRIGRPERLRPPRRRAPDGPQRSPGKLVDAHHRHSRAETCGARPEVGHEVGGHDAGRGDRDEPADG